MNYIEIYIHEVTRRLPEKHRGDIALELKSTIEDMLPPDYSEDDVKTVLEKLGNPVILAEGYRDRPMHLIGPRYFDIYMTLLKMSLPIAAVITIISVIAENFIGYRGEEAIINGVLDVIGLGVWRIIEVSIQVCFWATLVFAIMERVDLSKERKPLTASWKEWSVDDLKTVTYIPKNKSITKFEVFGGLLWTAIWATVYVYADHLVGIYEKGRGGLEFVIPAVNQEVLLRYWPIVLSVVCLEILLSIYKLMTRQWNRGLAMYNTAFQLVATIVFTVILLNPDVIARDFIAYMTELFAITANQLEAWIVGGGIFFFALSAAISIYDGIRKARIH